MNSSRCLRERARHSTGSRPRSRSMMYQVSVDGTSLGLRLVKTAIPMPKSGTSVISVPQPVTAIAVQLETKAIMRLAEFSVARRGVVDSRRMQFADQRCRQQMLAVELAFAEVQPH